MMKQIGRGIRIILSSLSLYGITHIIVIVLMPVALILSAFERARELQQLKVWFAKTVFWVIGQNIRVTGYENTTEQGRFLVVSNYPGGYAIFALITAFPQAAFVAHEFISRIPVLGQVTRQLGTIFVNPKNPRKSYREMDKAAEQGLPGSLIILPEGGPSPNGDIQPFKRGFAHILRRTDLDLLPVTLNGFYQLKPFMKRFYVDPDSDLEIFVHAPISNESTRQMTDSQLLETVQRIIRAECKPIA
jgi:1-acyl-sn-glycerol-3-phosphate acyltransferase